MQVEDGRGRGYTVGVNAENRMTVEAVTIPANEWSTDKGLSYNLNTDDITLTGVGESAVMYVKNNETIDMRIEAVAVGLDIATSSTAGAMANIYLVRNPTAGTIVDDATALPIVQQRNFGSNRSLVADTYVGDEGKTFTDGDNYIKLFHADSARLYATIDSTLTPGDSIGVTITPPAGNTSMVCYAALIIHLEEDI